MTTTTRMPGTGLTTADFQTDVQEFMAFAGIVDPHAFRQVGRAHVLA